MLNWEKCKSAFQSDGGLLDIYITPATINDWRLLYPLLCDYPTVEYFVDGVAQSRPSNVEKIFSTRLSANPLLRLQIDRTTIVFHFFGEDKIECDIMPKEITSQSDLDALLTFIRQIGDATSKSVLLTPENDQKHPLISYNPNNGTFHYHEV